MSRSPSYNQSKLLAAFDGNEDGKRRHAIEIAIKYTRGGINHYSGGSIEGGYYVHVTPYTVESGMKMVAMGAGRAILLEPAKRFNGKKIEALAAKWGESPAARDCYENVADERCGHPKWEQVIEALEAKAKQ